MIDPAFVSRLRRRSTATPRSLCCAGGRHAERHRQREGLRRAPRRRAGALGADDVRLGDFAAGRPNVWALREGAGGGPACFSSATPTPSMWTAGRALGGHRRGRTRSPAPWSTARSGAAAPATSRPASPPRSPRCAARPSRRAARRRRRLRLRRRRGERPAGHRRLRRHEGARRRIRGGRGRRGRTSPSMSSRRGSRSTPRRWASSSPTSRSTGRSAYFGVPELGRRRAEGGACRACRRCGRIRTTVAARADASAGRARLPAGHGHRGRRLHRGAGALHAVADPQAPAGRVLDAAAAGAGGGGARRGGRPRDPASSSPIRPAATIGSAARRPRPTCRLPPVRLLQAARPRGAMPGRGGSRARPSGRRRRSFTALGVPAVYCAPGDIRNCHTFEEHVELDEYFAGVVAYAAFIAAFGRPSA